MVLEEIIFIWLILMIVYTIYKMITEPEKPIKFKKILKKDDRKMYRVDYLSKPKSGRLRW